MQVMNSCIAILLAIIVVAVITLIELKNAPIQEQKLEESKKKARDIMELLDKGVFTLAELCTTLKELVNVDYSKLFDGNISSVSDSDKVGVDLYMSKMITEENLSDYFYYGRDIERIGSIYLVS